MPADAGKPRWTAARTLLLPLPAQAWRSLPAQLRLDGFDLRRKGELHATIVGRALGARIRERMAADARMRDAVTEAIAGLDWQWQRCRAWALLEKRDGARCRRSLVEHLRMPAMADFHRRLGTLLDQTLPVPPPHVTLYIGGGAKGIGLPDEATLERLRLRAVDATDLPDAISAPG
ncbi:MAG: hypothetical protein ACJ8GK_04090 [Luteimonas sp.]